MSERVLPHFHKEDRVSELDLIPDATIYTQLPVTAEEGRFAVKKNGSNYELHKWLDGAWRQVNATPFTPATDLFSSFIDIVHWHSVDGFTQSATSGGYTGNDGYLSLDVGSGSAGLYNFIYGTQPYTKILESGKALSVEWSVANVNDFNGTEIYLHMVATAGTPATTSHHFGFKLDGAIYGSTADGTTQSLTSSLAGIVAGQRWTRLRAVATRGTDVKFYINDALVSTKTTHLPATDNLRLNMGIITTNTDAKHVWLNRVLIHKVY